MKLSELADLVYRYCSENNIASLEIRYACEIFNVLKDLPTSFMSILFIQKPFSESPKLIVSIELTPIFVYEGQQMYDISKIRLEIMYDLQSREVTSANVSSTLFSGGFPKTILQLTSLPTRPDMEIEQVFSTLLNRVKDINTSLHVEYERRQINRSETHPPLLGLYEFAYIPNKLFGNVRTSVELCKDLCVSIGGVVYTPNVLDVFIHELHKRLSKVMNFFEDVVRLSVDRKFLDVLLNIYDLSKKFSEKFYAVFFDNFLVRNHEEACIFSNDALIDLTYDPHVRTYVVKLWFNYMFFTISTPSTRVMFLFISKKNVMNFIYEILSKPSFEQIVIFTK